MKIKEIESASSRASMPPISFGKVVGLGRPPGGRLSIWGNVLRGGGLVVICPVMAEHVESCEDQRVVGVAGG